MRLSTMARISSLAGVLSTAWVGTADANPVVSSGMRGVQVPASMHVQVTCLCAGFFGNCAWPTGLKRNGQDLTVTWLNPGGLIMNAGSGLVTFDARQACDCDVPAGTYTYALAYGQVPYPGYTPEVRVTVTDPPPAAREPDPGSDPESEDVDPWDIPEPPWPQGTDCSAFCADSPGGTATPTPTGNDPQTPTPTQTNTPLPTPIPTAVNTAEVVSCPGDSDGNGAVTVDELVEGVNIAMGTQPLNTCKAWDDDGDGSVTIDELLKAVNAALNGC